MKVLQLCNKSPYPAKEGGSIAMNAITQLLLKQGHEVKVIAVNTPKYNVDIDAIDPQYRKETKIELVYVDTQVRILGALKSLFSNVSYHVERFKSKELEQKLIAILCQEDVDVVIFETIYLAMYANIIRKYSRAKLILRAHNVEHAIWQRIVFNAPFGLKKLYLSILSRQLKTFEQKAIHSFDRIWCISPVDAEWFGTQTNKIPIDVIPFGTDNDQIMQMPATFRSDTLFSIGSMDWLPNREGVEWFLNNVWRQLHASYPTLTYKIAGRNMSETLKNTQIDGVEIVGEVADAKQFMLENGILIVPLWSGSGIRIKIIEAMSMGKVVITTTIGIEGIEAKNGTHILIANTSEEFLAAVDFCMQNPQKCSEIGKHALQLMRQYHNNAFIGEKLNALLAE